MYICTCQKCNEKLYVVFVNASISMHSELNEDGFSLENLKSVDTEDEIVRCHRCDIDYRLSELYIDVLQ